MVLKKKVSIVFIWGDKETSVKSRPNWDLTYAASAEALLLLFFEPGKFMMLQNWFAFSDLSVALPLGFVEEVDVASPGDKACIKVLSSALGALS